MTHAWKYMGSASENPMGVEIFGMVAGLGFVLSFGYWCTNFLVVQRAMAARNHVGRAAHTADRRVPQDVHPVHRDRARRRGAGALQDGPGLRPADEGQRPGLRPGDHDPDGEVLSRRNAGRRAHRPDGFVHVGHGGQRHRVQHGVDLRHLPELHPQGRAGPALPHGGPHHHDGGRAALDRRRPTWRSRTTTSWTCCNWSSGS